MSPHEVIGKASEEGFADPILYHIPDDDGKTYVL
jgi:hypothetical protein